MSHEFDALLPAPAALFLSARDASVPAHIRWPIAGASLSDMMHGMRGGVRTNKLTMTTTNALGVCETRDEEPAEGVLTFSNCSFWLLGRTINPTKLGQRGFLTGQSQHLATSSSLK
jgi:hypothetical protein